MSNLRHWLWLSTRSPAPGMYAARILEHFGTPERAYYADSAAYEAIPGLPGSVRQALEDKDLTPAETILTKCRQLGIWILTLQDAGYPQRLRQLDSAPLRPLRQGHPAPAGQPPHGGHRGGPAGQPLWGDGRPEVRHGPGPPGPGGGQRQRPRGGCRRPPGGPPGRGRGGVGAGQRHRRDLPRRQPGPLRRRGRRGGPAQ